MELQKQFSQEYVTTLKNQLGDPASIVRYEADEFPIEDNVDNIVKIPGLYHSQVDLVLSDKPSDDFENSKRFFNAYKSLSPLTAAQESFWAYLSHVEYFKYAKTRWPKDEKTNPANHYKSHFFIEGNMLKIARNAMARLWWPAFMTYDESHQDPFHLTKYLFSNTQVVLSMTESQLFTCKPLTHGVLSFFEVHDIIPTKESIDIIMKHFNALGGVRQLAFEEEDFFKSTIEKDIKLK